jgi:hypothetical protein
MFNVFGDIFFFCAVVNKDIDAFDLQNSKYWTKQYKTE